MALLLLAIQASEHSVLKPHVTYSLTKQPKYYVKSYISRYIKDAYIPPSTTPPSVLVVPGFHLDYNTDRGLAASLKTVADTIDQYDTVVVVGAYYPDSCGQEPPSKPITAYFGDEVETMLGNFDIDDDLRHKIGKQTGYTTRDGLSDELIEESEFFDYPFLWLRAMFPEGKKPKTKVLPVMLYATLRSYVQFAAQVLSDNLFKPKDNGSYGVAADGKRYLVIIPIRVSEGLDLYQNIYIENILLDLTFENKVHEFEEWLYYLTGSTGATFSKTIASYILVVRLSQLAARAVPHDKEDDPSWKWRVLDYYTTFDSLINVEKMKSMDYRSIDPLELEKTRKIFSDAEDSPKGHYIYYSMSLSLEPALHSSTTYRDGKHAKTAKLPVPVSSPDPFSKGAMDELMIAAYVSMQGKKYQKRENYQKYKSELTAPAPFSIRIYILADHSFEQKAIDEMKANSTFDQRYKDLVGMCEETVLFEEKIVNFYPEKDILTSIIDETQKLHSEKLSTLAMKKFAKELQRKYKELVDAGLLPKNKMKDLDFNLKQNLIIELQVFHSWEYKELFKLTEAKGNFITLWDGRTAVCEVPDTRPGVPHIIFFRLTQCALKAGLQPWDWQRANINTYDRTRLTKPVWQYVVKDEL